MLRRLIILFIGLTLISTSCQNNAQVTTPDRTPTERPIDQAKPTPSLTTAAPEKTATKLPTQVEVVLTEQPAGCTVFSPRPTPGPTERSVFPPVSDQDWVYGSNNADITLIEYSDFQ